MAEPVAREIGLAIDTRRLCEGASRPSGVSHSSQRGYEARVHLLAVDGYFVSVYFHFLTVAFFLPLLLNVYRRHAQTSHTPLAVKAASCGE